MDFSGIDAETRALVLELHIADLKAAEKTFNHSGKGKARADEDAHPDFETALQIQRVELALAVQVAADEHLARLMQQDDSDPAIEGFFITDRNGSRMLRHTCKRIEELGRKFLAVGDGHHDDDDPASARTVLRGGRSSSSSAGASSSNGRAGLSCTACHSETSLVEMAQFSCSHAYCRECVRRLCQAALDDDSMFPASCCNQPVELALLRRVLEKSMLERYEARDRRGKVVCHVSACGEFVPPERFVNGVAKCHRCGGGTCVVCHEAEHRGVDCPSDEGVKQVLSLGKVQGWQRCYSCRQMVELTHGCNHMICTCRAEFCYVCGKKWKTCLCAQMQEEYLITRANTRLPGRW